MIYANVPIEDARGATLVHSVRMVGLAADGREVPRRLSKGTVLGEAELEGLRRAGVDSVEVARPDPGDLDEDRAAAACAEAFLPEGDDEGSGLRAEPPATGRVNLRARVGGLFRAEAALIDHLNALDERLTVATLRDGTRVREGELVATIKVIPFFAPGEAVERWASAARDGDPPMRIARWLPMRVAHVSTTVPSLKESVLAKTRRALEARLAGTGAALLPERRCPHERDALTEALREARGADLTVVFGASAVTDAADVVPASIERAGGRIERVGMPVDPGNLLVLGSFGEERARRPVIGAPGCARSPAHNGFDMVLDRLLAGEAASGAEIGRMGVGGLLKEIALRPRPREATGEGDGPGKDGRADELAGKGRP